MTWIKIKLKVLLSAVKKELFTLIAGIHDACMIAGLHCTVIRTAELKTIIPTILQKYHHFLKPWFYKPNWKLLLLLESRVADIMNLWHAARSSHNLPISIRPNFQTKKGLRHRLGHLFCPQSRKMDTRGAHQSGIILFAAYVTMAWWLDVFEMCVCTL